MILLVFYCKNEGSDWLINCMLLSLPEDKIVNLNLWTRKKPITLIKEINRACPELRFFAERGIWISGMVTRF
jgi:hypothetical protein